MGGRAPPPEFLECDYKIQPDSYHVAKFQGDRSRELGERVAIKRKKMGRAKPDVRPPGAAIPSAKSI